MLVLQVWNILFYLLTSTAGIDNPIKGNDRDIVDTIAGEQCIIGTWPLNGSNLAIHVTKGNGARLNAFIDGSIGKHTTVQFGRLILKYNYRIMNAYLMFDKVSREDEGLYEIEESFYITKSALYDTTTEPYKRKDGRWSLELNVLETGEVNQGEIGDNITMEFKILSEISTLYNYDPVGVLLLEQGCSISTQSHLYGRLRCSSDKVRKMYRITIDNVTQKDAGLYKISTELDKSRRRFLNITGVCITNIWTATDSPLSVPLNPYSADSPLYESATDFIYTKQEAGSFQPTHIQLQRSFLEKRETFSFDVLSTTMTPLPVSQWEEVRTDQPVAQSSGTCNEIIGLHYAAIKDLTPVQTDCSGTYSLAELEDDKLILDSAVNCNKLSDDFNGMASAAFDYDNEEGILGECPSLFTLQTTIGVDANEDNGDVSRQVAHNGQATYAKVNKRPTCSSSNTEKQTPRHALVKETKEDDGYETTETAINQIDTNDAKVSEDEDGTACSIKNMEPKEAMIFSGIA